jgi:hypothetical protein
MTFSPKSGVRIYLNGELTAEDLQARNIDFSKSTAPLTLGNHNDHGTIQGAIDDVSLFHSFLSTADVLELYEKGNWPLERIAQYNFNGSAVDASGNGYDGVINGATSTTDRFGQTGAAYNFTSGNITASNIPIPNTLTISSWFKTNSDFAAGYGSIVDLAGTGALSIGQDNSLEASLQIGEDNFEVLKTPFPINDDQWHLATLTYDGEFFKLYLDDSLVSSNSGFAGSLFSYSNPTDINIGLTLIEGNSFFFDGDIDNIKYYGFALNEYQVKDLFDAGGYVAKPRFGPTNPSLFGVTESRISFTYEPAQQENNGFYITVRSTGDFVSDDFVQDGVEYSSYEFTSALDAYVIYPTNNADTLIDDFNENFPLIPETEYFYKIWRYNGSGTNIKYGNAHALTFSRSTLSTGPTDNAKNLIISNVTETSMQVDFTASEDPNVTGYLVLTASIIDDVLPNFNGGLLNEATLNVGDNFGDYRVISNGTGLSAIVDGLSPETRQTILIYTYTGTGNTISYSFSIQDASRFTMAAEPSTVQDTFTRSNPTTSGYTISFNDPDNSELTYDSLFAVENVNADYITSVYFGGSEPYYNPVEIGEFADNNSVEIRFGDGIGQKAHRFLVPEGATAGVTELNYTYQDYVEVPFEVWDIDRNIQLNVSFRDQDRNGVFNLLERNLTGTAIEQGREYMFISDTEYDSSIPNDNMTVNGGFSYRLMYQNWLHLTEGYTWDANALPQSIMRYAHYNKNNRGYVVVRNGSESPVDGNTYTVGESIGAGSIIYMGSETSFMEEGLASAIESQYAIYPYSGAGLFINYKENGILEGTASTLAPEPLNQTSDVIFSNTSETSFDVSFTAAASNPESYIVLRSNTQGVTDIPVDGVTYNLGDQIGGSIVASNGVNIEFEETGLVANTEYFYRVFAYNGTSSTNNYLTSAPLEASNTTLNVEPVNQPSTINFSDKTPSSFTVNYTPPAEVVSFIAIRTEAGAVPNAEPIDGNFYSVNDQIGNATVAYVGDQTSFVQDQLQSSTEYTYRIFASNGEGITVNYLTLNPLEGSVITLNEEPLNQPTDLNFSDTTSSSFVVNFVTANVDNSFIALRTVGQDLPDSTPEDGIQYNIGDQLGNAIVAYAGDQTTFSENQLQPSTIYNYQLFASNGDGDLINYLIDVPLQGFTNTFAQEPTNSAESLSFTDIDALSVQVNFAAGASESDGYIVLRYTDDQYLGSPADGTNYEVGDSIENSQVAYKGAGFEFMDSGLEGNTQYRYIIFSFNGELDSVNYLTTSGLTGFFRTLENEPTAQPTEISFSDISPNSLVLNFTAALDNPTGYLVVMSSLEMPSSLPQDGFSYNAGEYLDEGNSDLIVSQGNENSVLIEDLMINTEYHFAIYSYNGQDELSNYKTDNPLQGSETTNQDNTAPIISNITYSSEVDLDAELAIQLDVTDPESDITSVKIQYIKSNQGNYDDALSEEMTKTGNTYNFTIPSVGEEGIEFRIVAENSISLVTTSESFPIITRFANEGLSIPYSAFGNQQSNYRIISIPIELTNNRVNDVFGEQLGDYGDASVWRMFRYSNEETTELNGTTSLSPGNGYWLIANATDISFNTGPGTTVNSSLDEPFEIVLQPGWNQVGNPYTFDVSWANVLDYNAEELELRVFDGNWNTSNTLTAFSGGFVFWTGTSNLSMIIPKGTSSSSQNRTDEADEIENGWELKLELHADNLINNMSGIGMAQSANEGIDSKDGFNLPHFMDYVELSHRKELFNYSLSTDIVDLKENHTWTFDLTSNTNNSSILMKWENIRELDHLSTKELVLIDPINSTVIDMKNVNSYEFHDQNINGVKIIYGDQNYVNDALQLRQAQLYDPFPNPTNSNFNLSYYIPESLNGSSLQFDILDVRGNIISKKHFNEINNGLHQLIWDLRNESSQVSSGLYIINMKINQEIQLQKKVFIRN